MTQALLDPRSSRWTRLHAIRRGRAFATVLPFGQSLLLIWPQVVLLVAGTVGLLRGAYVAFMRQEVRA